tara:strand:- start:15563 stop:21700 length:6138 start_codon:yes stop_codon:yes gene_type:complete
MTLEEKKEKFRRKHGLPADYPVYTPEEYEAQQIAEQTSSLGAAWQGAKTNIIPGAGALLGLKGALTGLSKLPLPGLPGKAIKGVGAVGAALIGDVVTREGQEAVLDLTRTEDEKQAAQLKHQELRRQHPTAYTAGEVVGSALGGGVGPSTRTLTGLGEIVKTAGRGKVNKEVADFVTQNVGVGAGMGLAFEGGRQIAEGEFLPGALVASTVGGALFTKPVLHGKKVLGQQIEPVTEAAQADETRKMDFVEVTPKTEAGFSGPIAVERQDPAVLKFEADLTPQQQQELIDAYQKSHQIKEKGDADAKKAAEKSIEPDTEASSEELATELHRTDPKIKEALSKKKLDTPIKESVLKEGKAKIDKMVDDLPEAKLTSLQKQMRLGAATDYIKELGITPQDIKAELKKKIAANLGDMYESVKNLAARRNVSLRVATDELVTKEGNRILGFAPRKGREVILSLHDMNPETPFHELAHVFIRDLVGSSNKVESERAIKWLKDLYADHPEIKLRKPTKTESGEAFTESQKNRVLELFAQETGERLLLRMRNLPKGKFAKMRRWYEDVQRTARVKSREKGDSSARYSPAAKTELLDYIAQRMEIDRNPLTDVDINTHEGTKLDAYVKAKQGLEFDLQLAPDESSKSTLVVDGVKYTSTANAYAIPKEVAEIFNIPDMPKGFAKKYADNINKLKAGVVNRTEYTGDLEYLDSFNFAELPDYPKNYKKMMKGLQQRNTGALKQIFKMFEDEQVDIILETSQPDLPTGAHSKNEIRINVPTVDNSFDMVLAQHMLNRHLANNKDMMNDLTGLWGRMLKTERWSHDFEPEMVTRFVEFAARNDLPEELQAVIAKYYNELDIANINFSQRFGNKNESMLRNYELYSNRMLGQGNALHGALRNLPDDLRMKFANTMIIRNRWGTPEEFLREFDAMMDTIGLTGSRVREDFYSITRSPQHIMQSAMEKGTYDVLDGISTLSKTVNEAQTATLPGFPLEDPTNRIRKYWEARKIPESESMFARMPALDAMTQLAENATGIKGLKNVFERVQSTPVPPRSNREVDFSLGEVIAEETGRTDALLKGIKPFSKKVTPTVVDDRTKKEREVRFKTLPDPKLREPLTWKPFQRALRGMRPIVDRVRELGLTKSSKELAHYIADKLNATTKDENLLRGQFLEKLMLAFSEVKLSPAELNTLGDFQLDRWRSKMGLQKNIDEDLLKEYLNNPRLRYFDRMMENIYRDTRQYQNDIGMLVETFRNGTRTLGPGKYTAEYTPEIINQEVRRVLMKVPDESPEHQALKKEAVDYWMSIAKKTDKDELKTALSDVDPEGADLGNESVLRGKFEVMFDNMAHSLKATQHTLGSQKYKALRVATGRFGIPKNWVERNAMQRLTRYVVRFTKDAAFFKNIEGDEKSRKILGIPDQLGNYSDPDIPGLEKGGPFNLKNVVDGKIVDNQKGKTYNKDVMGSDDSLDAFMQGYIGFYESWDLWSRNFNRMVTSSWLGLGAGLRDYVSSYLFALPYMRTQDLPLLVTHMFEWRDAFVKSHTMGVNKTALNNLEWTQQSVSEVTDGINKAADFMLVAGGRSVLERNTRALQFSLGRQLTRQALRQGLRLTEYVGIGDWTANRLLRNLDQQMGGGANYRGRRVSLSEWVGSKEPIPQEVLDQAGAAWVEINQGTYDMRGLPKFTQRGVPSMFTSLARWSIEKSDRMAKDIWLPLRTQGDFLPLLKATFGAILGGEAIKYLSEEIANKVQSDPKLIEAIQMDNPKEQLQAIINSVAFAGYFGLQSAVLHDVVRASRRGVLEGIPGGLTFPAADAATTIARDFFHLMSSGSAFDEGFAKAWLKFFRSTVMGINQTLRYSLQHLTLSDDMSDFNARAQLRKFRTLEKGELDPGVPAGISNPYDWPARIAFKRAKSVAEARRLLPAAVKEAAEKAMSVRPDNPVEQSRLFKQYWQALYARTGQGFTPALPSTREESRHLERMRYLGLKASPKVESKMHRKKPAFLGSETFGQKLVDFAGGEMMPGTVITKDQAKSVMAQEKQFFHMTEAARDMVLRYIGSRGRSL